MSNRNWFRYGTYENAELWRTCFHEAGHAVVACMLDVPVLKVTIEKVDLNDNNSGKTTFDLTWPLSIETGRKMATVSYSGCLAAINEGGFYGALGGSHDALMAISMLSEADQTMNWEALRGELQQAETSAVEMVCTNRRSIQIVAETLSKARTIDGAFLQGIVKARKTRRKLSSATTMLEQMLLCPT